MFDADPDAIEPSAPTATGPASGLVTVSKNALPRLFVADGPLPVMSRNTGRSGTAASSSASVGSRCSANMFVRQPPIAVMNSPAGTLGRRAASSSWISAMFVARSITTWWPGRLPRLTKWMWLSIRPGMTVRPLRLIDLVLRCRSTRLPTSSEAAVPDQRPPRRRGWRRPCVDLALGQDEALELAVRVLRVRLRRRRPGERLRAAEPERRARGDGPGDERFRDECRCPVSCSACSIAPPPWPLAAMAGARTRDPSRAGLDDAGVEDDLAADDGEHRLDLLQLLAR